MEKNYYLGTFEMQTSALHTLRAIWDAKKQMDHTYGVRQESWSDHTQERSDALLRIPEVADVYAKLDEAKAAVLALHKLFGSKKGQYLSDYLPQDIDKTS